MFERLILRYTTSRSYLDIVLHIFGISFLFTLLSVFLVQHVVIFRIGGDNLSGMMVVLFTSLAVAYPFVRYLLQGEEKEVSERWNEERLLHRHLHELVLYLSFFFGTMTAFAISSFFVSPSFYSIQCSILGSLNLPIGQNCRILTDGTQFLTGSFLSGGVTGNAAAAGDLMLAIIRNNLFVMGVTFVITFFLTSGIIFILAWNASVLGVWIGSISSSPAHIALFTLPYLLHAILEIGGYVLAGVAGALLSYQIEALITHDEGAEAVNQTVLMDVIILLVLGVLAILAGGYVEVFGGV